MPPQHLSLNLSYDLPIGTNKPFLNFRDWRRHLVDGWSVSDTSTIQDGGPIAPRALYNNTGGVLNTLRADVVPGVDPKVSNPGPDLWFNPAAFIQPADFTMGNASRTLSILNPGLQNSDVSLAKRFAIDQDPDGGVHHVGLQFSKSRDMERPGPGDWLGRFTERQCRAYHRIAGRTRSAVGSEVELLSMLRRELLSLLAATSLAIAEGASKSAAPGGRCRVTAWLGDPPLESNQIRATVEGKEAKILAVHDPESPLLLNVVLDLTGDMALIEPARAALKAGIAAQSSNVWVSLLRAQDGLRVLTDPGPDRAAVDAQLDALETTGRAGLLEAVQPAAELAERIVRHSPIRTAVLFLTDSNIYNYREDYTNPVVNPSDSRDLSRRFPEALIREKTAKLAASLNAIDVPIFVHHLAWLRDRLNEAYQAGLQQIAEATGGTASFSRSPGDIAGDLSQMIKKIVSHWAVDLELPAGTKRTYSVQLAVEGREIQYRTKYTLAARAKGNPS